MFFEWAGSKFDWVSVQSFAMVITAVVLLVAFVFAEKESQERMEGLAVIY